MADHETRRAPACHYDRTLGERVTRDHRDDCPNPTPRQVPTEPLTCDNEDGPRGVGSTSGGLTRTTSTEPKEGLAMKATPKTCDAPGCDRPARTRNYAWCTLHDRRVRLYGSVDLPPGHVRHRNEGHVCAATECPEPAKAKGYCGLHWERIRRHGSPDIAMPAVARQVVYFVLASNSRKVKIGLTNDPDRRLATLQTGSAEPLKLLGVVPGGRRLETQLHRDLADDRSHGEWFHCTEHVMGRVAHLLGGVPAERTA